MEGSPLAQRRPSPGTPASRRAGVPRPGLARHHHPNYRTAIVTPACVDRDPNVMTTGTAAPVGALSGTKTFTCVNPQISPGEGPAYSTGASTPPTVARTGNGCCAMPPAIIPSVPFSPPTVINTIAARPRATGFPGPFTLKFSSRIAPCPLPELAAVKIPGAESTTGKVTGALFRPL